MMTAMNQPTVSEAARVPALSHAEAGLMARVELERFLALVKSLTAADWDKPTDCTLWNVRQILAHQAGAYAGFASWAQFRRQWGQLRHKPPPGQLPVDLINRCQVEDRDGRSPAELIAELEEVGPKAINTRQRLPLLLRALRLPFGPPLGFVRVDYLTDLIYTRDTWSHRLDICRAAGREMHLTAEHDGRTIALVVRELAAVLKPMLGEEAVILNLTGPLSSSWRLGRAGAAAASLQMDTLQFSRLTSGRLAPDQASAQALVTVSGDAKIAKRVLEHALVPY